MCLALFDTAHMALRFEKVCRAAGLDVRVVPVPRTLSASCGLACRYPCDDEERIKTLAAEESVDVASFHTL